MNDRYEFLVVLKGIQEGRINASKLAEAGRDWVYEPQRPISDYIMSSGWLSGHEWSEIESGIRSRFDRPTSLYPLTRGNDDSDDTSAENNPFDSNENMIPDIFDARDETIHGFGYRYEGVKLHALGGPSLVHEACDTLLGRVIAVKELRPALARNTDYMKRFAEEGKLTAQMSHPNIVPVHDLSPPWSARPYFTMPLLGSRTLKHAIQEHHHQHPNGDFANRSFRDLIDALLAVCNAIKYAHSRKRIIHRDIKGVNVILGPFGEVIMLDWGLAKRLGEADDPLAQPVPGMSMRPDASIASTAIGQPIGTLTCMPPEQAEGEHEKINERSDVFGLGALLYHLLTNRTPYESDNRDTLTALARACEPLPPRVFAKGVPAALEAVCLKAMRKDPQDRYASAEAFAEEVRRWRDDEPVEAYRDLIPARFNRWARRNQPILSGIGAVLLTSVIGLGIGLNAVNREKVKVTDFANKAEQARGQADSQRILAEEDLASALAMTIRTLDVLRNKLPAVSGSAAERLRLQVASDATKAILPVVERHPRNLQIKMAICDIFRESAKVHILAYRLADASRLYETTIRNMQSLQPEDLAKPYVRDRLAEYWLDWGSTIRLKEGPAAALPMLDKALKLARGCLDERPGTPEYRRTEARVLAETGLVDRDLGKFAEAETKLAQALACFESLATSAEPGAFDLLLQERAASSLGQVLHESGRTEEARKRFQEAKALAQKLVSRDLSNIDARYVLAHVKLRDAMAREGADSNRDIDGAIADFRALSKERPDVFAYRQRLALACIARCERLTDKTKFSDATADLEEARESLATILKVAPEMAECMRLEARAILSQARIAIDLNDLETAKKQIAELEARLVKLTKFNPENPDTKALRTMMIRLMDVTKSASKR